MYPKQVPVNYKNEIISIFDHNIFLRVFYSEMWIRIQLKVKEHINKSVNSGLFVLLDSSIE